MKNRMFILAFMLLTTQFAFSQVKKQYQDETYGQTTVIIKDDQATDLEILNSMDLDEFGIDQVIKITTEDIRRMEEKKKNPQPEAVAVTQKKSPKKTIILDPTGPERWIPTTKPRKKEKPVAQVSSVEKKAEAPNLGGSYKKSKTTSKSSKRSRVTSSKKTRKYKSGKRKNPRFKKKKRKRSRRKYSCYQF